MLSATCIAPVNIAVIKYCEYSWLNKSAIIIKDKTHFKFATYLKRPFFVWTVKWRSSKKCDDGDVIKISWTSSTWRIMFVSSIPSVTWILWRTKSTNRYSIHARKLDERDVDRKNIRYHCVAHWMTLTKIPVHFFDFWINTYAQSLVPID